MSKESESSELKISRWVDQLRAGLPLGDVIAVISERMIRVDGGEDHCELAQQLVSLLSEDQRDDEVVRLCQEMTVRYPDEVVFPLRNATYHLYFSNNPETALNFIDAALERARRTRFFLREALGVKARIFLELGRDEELPGLLEEIMLVKIDERFPDIGRERDFVDRAPPGIIPEDVLARYNQFRPKRASDTTVNEPPQWEPPQELEW